MTYPFVTGGAPATPGTWLEAVATYYRDHVHQWIYTRDHYTGRCVEPERVPAYLIRKKIGEPLEAYEERVLLADYTPHFASVVDTLAGMLAQVEDDATRVWGRTAKGGASKKTGPLGDPRDPDTLIGRLWADADGSHNGWLTLWQLLATDLVALHDGWVFVDGGPDGTLPRVRIFEAEAVTNWREADGTLVEALVSEVADLRTTLDAVPGIDNPESERQWLHFTIDGWQRYRIVKDKDGGKSAEAVGDPGTWRYQTRDGRRTIPLYRVQLPLRRNVGFMMARKANALFNKESERDHLLRFACFPLLNIFASDTGFKKIVKDLREGARVLQVGPNGQAHAYAAPSSEPANVLNATIQDKREEFYATALREFGTNARSGRDRVTAMEVKTDIAVGVAAFLGLLRSAIDNAENAALYLLEQTAFKNDPTRWGLARVDRSHDFTPFDVNAVIERLRTRYIGLNEPVPIGPTALAQVVKEIAEWDGIETVETEVAIATRPAPPFVAAPIVDGKGDMTQ